MKYLLLITLLLSCGTTKKYSKCEINELNKKFNSSHPDCGEIDEGQEIDRLTNYVADEIDYLKVGFRLMRPDSRQLAKNLEAIRKQLKRSDIGLVSQGYAALAYSEITYERTLGVYIPIDPCGDRLNVDDEILLQYNDRVLRFEASGDFLPQELKDGEYRTKDAQNCRFVVEEGVIR